ncbi:MAG: thioredoxin family protein [Deltaproteobacteria bacterium]|nr:thioredoxin family protein [Deltaproteobacteria bacterium]
MIGRASLLLFLALGVAALAPTSGAFGIAADPTVQAEWRLESSVAGGDRATSLVFAVELSDGWHVNAHDPDRPYLIPTELTVEPPPGAAVEAVRYPEPVIRSLRFAVGAPLRLYEGRFTIGVRLSGDASGPITGRLRYQACDDERCLPPRTLAVTLTLGATAAAAPAAPPPAELATAPSGAIAAAPATRIEEWMRERGLVVTLALAALFGLGLNLTPCVYPLISVTIAYFGGQSRTAHGRVLTLAAAYVLGIAITFSALGVAAALSGGFFGAALQRPLVLAGIAALLVVLAASNFGLYQLRGPAALTTRVGKASRGVLGALAMGLTMGVVAAPCVGPIVIGLLLFVAARQDAVLGFALFFSLAIGMGAPYLALAVVAGSIRRLPRSGEWLTWIEHLFGFVLLGMALYFAAPLLGDRIVAVVAPLLIAVAGVYLGFVDHAGSALRSFATLRRAGGVLAVAAAIWVAVPYRAQHAIAWEPFSPAALAHAASVGRPTLVDFTARWCLPCRENDTITFVDAAVAAEAERFTMLRADVTEMTPDREDWMQRFQVLGVPTIVLVGSSGVEEARAIGFVEAERLVALMRERR